MTWLATAAAPPPAGPALPLSVAGSGTGLPSGPPPPPTDVSQEGDKPQSLQGAPVGVTALAASDPIMRLLEAQQAQLRMFAQILSVNGSMSSAGMHEQMMKALMIQADTMTSQREREFYPHVAQLQKHQRFSASLLKDRDTLTKHFVTAVKSGSLTPFDTMLGCYMYLGNATDTLWFAAMLAYEPDARARIRHHNWRIIDLLTTLAASPGQEENRAFLDRWGPVVDLLEWPMLPAHPDLDAHQAQFLNNWRASLPPTVVQGAGESAKRRATQGERKPFDVAKYFKLEPGDRSRKGLLLGGAYYGTETVKGAGWAMVTTDPETGAMAADLSQLEQALSEGFEWRDEAQQQTVRTQQQQAQQLARLQRDIAAAKSTVRRSPPRQQSPRWAGSSRRSGSPRRGPRGRGDDTGDDEGPECYACGERGHLKRECPTRREDKQKPALNKKPDFSKALDSSIGRA